MKKTIHLIPNAHLDPVWLWDWREGLNEGLTTVRTILNLMDEEPELTFIRGESVIYQHIAKNDPETFQRIRQQIAAGRWDVVGGTVIQPDTNLPSTAVLLRQFQHGLAYFQQALGVRPTVAWAADSFGHSAGYPAILRASGMDSFAFTRPFDGDVTLPKPAFWWEGPGDCRVLAYRPYRHYCTERGKAGEALDWTLQRALTSDVDTVACFLGLGNHGGGPTRRDLEEVQAWRKGHPEVQVVFSGLHRFFAALRAEIADQPEDFLPVHRGELNYCLRGCYASVARFKFPYRLAEAQLVRAEATDAGISAFLQIPAADLSAAWSGQLFNAFHDILPGTSIERAVNEQIALLGKTMTDAQTVEFEAINALAAQIDTTIRPPERPDQPTGVPVLAWNPHPFPYLGPVEIEFPLDYRPLWNYKDRDAEVPVDLLDESGQPVPFQVVETEHHAIVGLPFRRRVVFLTELPPLGWRLFEAAYREEPLLAAPLPQPASAPSTNSIANTLCRVEAQIGAPGISIVWQDRTIFHEPGLGAAVFEDPYGSWGGMVEEHASTHVEEIRETWKVRHLQVLESGPIRSRLWVQLAGARSRLDLTFSLLAGRAEVRVSARVFWNERSARLKLLLPVGDQAEFDVPGASVRRGPSGEVPGGRWVRIFHDKEPTLGFASDALYGFETLGGVFRPTIVRASRYADDVVTPPEVEIWRPATDAGELVFQFLLAPPEVDIISAAQTLERPPVVQNLPPHPGKLPRIGSLCELSPGSVELLALQPLGPDAYALQLRNHASEEVQVYLRWQNQSLSLGSLRAGEIALRSIELRAETWHHGDS